MTLFCWAIFFKCSDHPMLYVLRILLLPSAFPSVFAFSIHISNSSAAYLIPKPTALLHGIPCCDICRLEYTKQIFMVPLLFRKWKFMQRRGSSGATPFPQDNSRWRQDNAPAKTLPCIFRKKRNLRKLRRLLSGIFHGRQGARPFPGFLP